MIGAGHYRLAAGRGDRLDDARIVGRHPDRPDVRLDRAAPDMDDHRRAVNVGERLSRKARCVHARRDEDDGTGHPFRLSQIRGAGAYTCCQGKRKAANQLDETNPRTLAQPHSSRRKSLCLMDHVNVNRVSLSALGSVLFVMLLTAFSNLLLSPRTPKVPGFALPTAAPAAAPPPRPGGAGRAAARPARQGRRRERRDRLPRSAKPVTISRRAAAPRSGRPLGRGWPQGRFGARLRVFRRDQGRGRRLVL